MLRTILSFAVLLLVASAAVAQCGDDQCQVESTYSWREHPEEIGVGKVYLYRDGVQIGGWNDEKGYWRDYDAARDAWAEPRPAPPVPIPPRFKLSMRNFGVVVSKIEGTGCQLNGKAATRSEIDAAIVGADVPDDSKRFRLVANGSDEERKRIVEAWQQIEPQLLERVLMWNVPGNHWSLKDTSTGKTAFAPGGITFQAPDGKVLHRQPDFAGAQDFQAIRKAVKAYDASKDPDLRKPEPKHPAPQPVPGPVESPNSVPQALSLVAIALFALLRKEDDHAAD